MIGSGFNSLYCSNLVDFTKAEQKKFNESKKLNTNPVSIIDPDRFEKKKDPLKTVAEVALLAAAVGLALKYGKSGIEKIKNSKIVQAGIEKLKNLKIFDKLSAKKA